MLMQFTHIDTMQISVLHTWWKKSKSRSWEMDAELVIMYAQFL